MRASFPLLFLLLAGCLNTITTSGAAAAIPMARVRAESDLDCPQADIRIEEEVGGRLKAIGCGRKASYTAMCNGLQCEVRGEGERPLPFKERPDPGGPMP
jgi:hypothetical protein